MHQTATFRSATHTDHVASSKVDRCIGFKTEKKLVAIHGKRVVHEHFCHTSKLPTSVRPQKKTIQQLPRLVNKPVVCCRNISSAALHATCQLMCGHQLSMSFS